MFPVLNLNAACQLTSRTFIIAIKLWPRHRRRDSGAIDARRCHCRGAHLLHGMWRLTKLVGRRAPIVIISRSAMDATTKCVSVWL